MSGLFCVTSFRTRECLPCAAYLEAKHLSTADDLDAALHTMQGKIDTLKKSASGKQARIKELDELLRMADYYKAGKPVADKLKTIRFEKSRQKYKAEHDDKANSCFLFLKSTKSVLVRLIPPNKNRITETR